MRKEEWLFGAKTLGIILLGAALNSFWIRSGTVAFYDSHIGNFMLLGLVLTGGIQLALRKRTGWLWIGTFLYFSAYKHPGIPAWLYAGLAAGCLMTYRSWKKNALAQTKTNSEG